MEHVVDLSLAMLAPCSHNGGEWQELNGFTVHVKSHHIRARFKDEMILYIGLKYQLE
jgi:hypothetical protein